MVTNKYAIQYHIEATGETFYLHANREGMTDGSLPIALFDTAQEAQEEAQRLNNTAREDSIGERYEVFKLQGKTIAV